MEQSYYKVRRSKTAGHIKVHQSEYLKDLTLDASSVRKEMSKDDSFIVNSPVSQQCSNLKLRKTHSSNVLGGWLSEKSIKVVQEKTDYESKEMANMYYSLLDNEEKLQKDLDEILVYDHVTKNRKLHWLLQRWHEKTFIPLDNKICEEINSVKWMELDAEKRKEFIKYLKHRNKKGHVFLDIYEEAEYDPMRLNKQRPGPITAVTEKLEDPLLFQQHKRNNEDRVMHACDSGVQLSDGQLEARRLPKKPLIPLGRHETECNTWLNMKLYDIQSHVRIRSQERLYGIRNVSTGSLQETGGKCSSETAAGGDKWRKRRQFPGKFDTTFKLL